jgi:hypothetical protein
MHIHVTDAQRARLSMTMAFGIAAPAATIFVPTVWNDTQIIYLLSLNKS